MNFSPLKLWDHWAEDESFDNKITMGTELGGLLPRLEFAFKAAINLSKSGPTNQRLVIYLFLIFLKKGVSGFNSLILLHCFKKKMVERKRDIAISCPEREDGLDNLALPILLFVQL